MLTCREIARGISSGEIETAPWYRRLGCWFHLLMCPDCREFSDQIRRLGEVMRQEAVEPDSDRLSELESRILGEFD